MKTLIYQLVWLVPVLLLASCQEDETQLEKWRKEDDDRINTYLSTNDISATRDGSGLYYEVLSTNVDGEAVEENNIVTVTYSISTLDNKILHAVDSSSAVSFLHDYQSVLPIGIDYAVSLMKKGERFRFYIPSVLGYGDYSTSNIEPYTILVVNLFVMDVQSMAERNMQEINELTELYAEDSADNESQITSSGLIYEIEVEGTGGKPVETSTVQINYECAYLDGTLVDRNNPSNPVSIEMDGGNIIKGLKEGILKMNKGESATFTMPSQLAFGASVQVFPTNIRNQLLQDQILLSRVLPFSPLVYKVELLDIN